MMVEEFQAAFYRLIESGEKVYVEKIATEIDCERRVLNEIIKKETGYTSKKLQEKLIIEYMEESLQQGDTETDTATKLDLALDTLIRIYKRHNEGKTISKGKRKILENKNKGFMDSHLYRKMLSLIILAFNYLVCAIPVAIILMLIPSEAAKCIGIAIMYADIGVTAICGCYFLFCDVIVYIKDKNDSVDHNKLYVQYIRKMATMIEMELVILACLLINSYIIH